MEKEQQVKTYKITLQCPDCEIDMAYAGLKEQWFKSSSKHKYECSKCKATHESDKLYPYMKYTTISSHNMYNNPAYCSTKAWDYHANN